MAATVVSAEGLIAWLMGQPNVGADIKRAAGLTGALDHFGAAGFIRGLLEVMGQTGQKGLLLVLDEVETIQRVRADSREKSLNALRHLVDELYGGYPGLTCSSPERRSSSTAPGPSKPRASYFANGKTWRWEREMSTERHMGVELESRSWSHTGSTP